MGWALADTDCDALALALAEPDAACEALIAKLDVAVDTDAGAAALLEPVADADVLSVLVGETLAVTETLLVALLERWLTPTRCCLRRWTQMECACPFRWRSRGVRPCRC